jgi:hypothetical protein
MAVSATDQVRVLVSYDNRAYDHSAPSQGEIYEDLPPVDLSRSVNYDYTINSNENLEVSENSEIQVSQNTVPDTVDINQLVDQVVGIDPEEHQSTGNILDETFEPENLTQTPIIRDPYPKRSWKPSRKVKENLLHNAEPPALNTMTGHY